VKSEITVGERLTWGAMLAKMNAFSCGFIRGWDEGVL
jgi:hypothetical protein